MDGTGVYSYADGSVYSGTWRAGRKDGAGRMEWAQGDVYDGTWADGEMSGPGRLVAADGRREYDGEWLRGRCAAASGRKNARARERAFARTRGRLCFPRTRAHLPRCIAPPPPPSEPAS